MNSTIKQRNNLTIVSDNFGADNAARMATTVMHEAGHPFFNDHPSREEMHIPGTMMQKLPAKGLQYDPFMVQRLLEIYGPAGE